MERDMLVFMVACIDERVRTFNVLKSRLFLSGQGGEEKREACLSLI